MISRSISGKVWCLQYSLILSFWFSLFTPFWKAEAANIKGTFNVDSQGCEPELPSQRLTEELGVDPFPREERITKSEMQGDPICKDGGASTFDEWLVSIKNVSNEGPTPQPTTYKDLYFVADLLNIANFNRDGTVTQIRDGAKKPGDAFKIDAIDEHQPLKFVTDDSGIRRAATKNDILFKPGYTWEFLVVNWPSMNPDDSFKPPTFGSVGVFGGDSMRINMPADLQSDASILANKVPEPSSTLSLIALGILGAGSTLKRKLKTYKSPEKPTEKVG